MCSPELAKGMCTICCGTLTSDNTFTDRFGNVWDVHKGVCAIHAGNPPEGYHAAMYAQYMKRMKNASTQFVRQEIIKSFYKWVIEIADENHYDMSAPKC